MGSSLLFTRECAAAATPWLLPLQSPRMTSSSAATCSCSFAESRNAHYRRRIASCPSLSSGFQRIWQLRNFKRFNSSTTLGNSALAGNFFFTSRFAESRRTQFIRAATESGNEATGDEDAAGRSGADGDGNEGTEERTSGVSNGAVDALKHFFEDFARELKNETGFNSAAAGHRLAAEYYVLREKIEDGVAGAQDVVQTNVEKGKEEVTTVWNDVRHKYWPQFLNWNRLELWKVSSE
jgi:hypothetical protein